MIYNPTGYIVTVKVQAFTTLDVKVYQVCLSFGSYLPSIIELSL